MKTTKSSGMFKAGIKLFKKFREIWDIGKIKASWRVYEAGNEVKYAAFSGIQPEGRVDGGKALTR